MNLLILTALTTVGFAQDSDDDYAIDLSKGTLQVGGAATANIAFIDENPDVFLIISPSGGIMVADRTLVNFELDLLVDEVEGFDAGVSLGLDYFFPGQWVAPYVGVGVGYGTRQLDDAPSPYSFPDLSVVSGSGRLGILMPASKTIGIDIGAEVNVNFGFGGDETQTWVTVPMGFAGVRAFFN
ncbi:MAG: hypothetical protein AAF211_31440 [Myxococcota bacterium]